MCSTRWSWASPTTGSSNGSLRSCSRARGRSRPWRICRRTAVPTWRATRCRASWCCSTTWCERRSASPTTAWPKTSRGERAKRASSPTSDRPRPGHLYEDGPGRRERVRKMAELGFWSIAQENPDHLAVVDPDGREVDAGTLLASCNQVVHGLRALGLEPGDAVAMVLPNSIEVFELYLAVLQAGFYLVPINHHLVGPEIAYIVDDSEAKAFVAHERFADTCVAAADEIDFPKDGRFAVGDVPGFRS